MFPWQPCCVKTVTHVHTSFCSPFALPLTSHRASGRSMLRVRGGGGTARGSDGKIGEDEDKNQGENP